MRLDIGCGLRKQPRWIGLDINRSSTADVIGDMKNLPFKARIATEIKCIHALEHLDEDSWQGKYEISQAVAEFARVLKEQGTILIEVPSPQSEDAVRGGA